MQDNRDTQSARSFRQPGNSWLVGILLALILLLGGYFRFTGLNWDEFTHFHPDERFLTQVITAIGGGLSFTPDTTTNPAITPEEQMTYCLERYPDTHGIGGFFDARCSNYNPHNVGQGMYVYGTLPLFIAKIGSEGYVQLTGNANWARYEGAHLVWRVISALADMGTILVLFFIGSKLHNKWVGLLAALLYACAPLAIQKSHFATVNAMTNFFVTLTLLFAARVQKHGKWIDYALFGVMFAASISSRINTLPLIGVVVVAAIMRGLPALDPDLPWQERQRLFFRNLLGLMLAVGVGLVAFRLFSPYAFNGPGLLGIMPNSRFIADVETARYQVSGASEIPPNWQWIGRPGYLFPLWNIILWGMGAAVGISAVIGWVWSMWRLLRGKPGASRNLVPLAWVTAYFLFIGNLWVMSMRYYLPLYSMLALLAAWTVVEWVQRTNTPETARWCKVLAWGALVGVAGFAVLWGLMFTNIYRSLMTTVQASYWLWENVPGDFAMRLDDVDAPLINIAINNRYSFGTDNEPLTELSQLEPQQPASLEFVAPADGTVTSVHAPHLGDLNDNPEPETLHISITETGSEIPLSEATFSANFTREDDPFGEAYDIPLDRPMRVSKGQHYFFTVQVMEGGPVSTAGTIMTWEGSWDEVLPVKVCALPDGMTLADNPSSSMFSAENCNGRDVWSGLFNGYKMEVVWDDIEPKRDLWIKILDTTDYIIIGTNRRYDSQSRIPSRWPMTNRYYDALFSGELGFELAAQFDETFEFGPFRASDQYLPSYTAPRWLNEFEAEEAFHVYDHPAVFIFRKSDTYSSDTMREILYSVPLNKVEDVSGLYSCTDSEMAYCDPAMVGVIPWYSLAADKAPTQLKFTTDMAETQYSSGTWSDRFDTNSLINTHPLVTMIGWWLTIIVFGLVAWPLLFAIFPALVDRGYGVAKLVGILVTAWLTWLMASMRVPLWNQGGILLVLLVFTAMSAFMGWRVRRELVEYVRQHWQRLAWIEIITVLAFLFFLFVRLTNPDLWHPAKGGEKPMDFAYFNGVLRSTIFPPIDPWQSGGYLNYYYFGYVIVGVPTLLLGVVPSVAYNLIIPTVFALTGTAAFSVVFNIVGSWREWRQSHYTNRRRRLGNPWVAGIAALLLTVVLGNLDTIRVLGTGIARLGGYETSLGLEQYLTEQYTDTYGMFPDGAALVEIKQRAEANYIGDRLDYEVNHSISLVVGIIRGMGEVINGKPLPIGTDRWYWGPSRVLAEAPGVEGNAITEMPYFTFLYGDLHAHMIDMPIMLLILAFLFHELVAAENDSRSTLARFLALALGSLAVAVTWMTNTWDWVTFLLLSVLGLIYAWWIIWRRINRWSLLSFAGRIGGFVALNFLFMLPYATWFATTSAAFTIWQGGKTPLWAYFDIHGLFLFLIVSLLIWDTARWFSQIRVRNLRGTWPLLLTGLIAFFLIIAGVCVAAAAGYQVALIVVPLVIWIAILFFRAGQSRAMQFVLVLAGLGLSLTLGVEVIVLGADIGRQNTVFKFYMQTWLLFSIAGGAAFAWLIQNCENWGGKLRNTWFVLVSILIILAAMYPVMATRGRAADRMGIDTPITLDGMEYMRHSRYGENEVWMELDHDYQLIRWMQENIQGSPVIMEAQSAHEYLWGSRIAIYTGLPSVIGWNFHQTQQHTFDPLPQLVRLRASNVNAFYTEPDIQTALAMIRWYDIGYIVVGGLERAYYSEEGLAKFDTMAEQGLLELVYDEGEAEGRTQLYRVNADAVKQAAVVFLEEQGE